MKKFYNLLDILLKLCNSWLKVSLSKGPNFSLVKVKVILPRYRRRNFILKAYKNEKGSGFQIIIMGRRSEDHGEKVSNDF